MCCTWTCMVVLTFAILYQNKGVAVSSQNESATLLEVGVRSCQPVVTAVRAGGHTRSDGLSSRLEAAKASGHVEDGAGEAGCQFASSLIELVEEYAAHLDLSYVNFIVRGECS